MSTAEIAKYHETLFVQTFIDVHRRDRYLKQLTSPKRRPQFLDLLNSLLGQLPEKRIPARTKLLTNEITGSGLHLTPIRINQWDHCTVAQVL